MAKKAPVPPVLRICLVGHRFQILSRATDAGLLWPVARGLARQGHHVTVLSTKSPMGKLEVQREGVTTWYLHEQTSPLANTPFRQAAYQKFLELHQKEPFHLVHSLDDSGYKIGRRRKNLKVGLAYDVEATQMSQLFSIMGMGQENVASWIATHLALAYKFVTTYLKTDRRLLSTADGVFVTTPQQRQILEQYYLFPDQRIHTVPYGVEFGDLVPKENPQDVRRRLDLPDYAQIAVTISDMTELHEIVPLLRAFERVAIKKPHTYLVILGTGPRFKQIEYQVLSLALGNRVRMPGAIRAAELLDHLVLGDVFINLSSRTTGYGEGVIEAMAQKKVVIGSEVSTLSHLVEDGVDGFLIRPADSESLASLMLEIFSQTLNVQEIGEKARQKVSHLFDLQRMIQSTIDAYHKVLLNTGQYLSSRDES